MGPKLHFPVLNDIFWAGRRSKRAWNRKWQCWNAGANHGASVTRDIIVTVPNGTQGQRCPTSHGMMMHDEYPGCHDRHESWFFLLWRGMYHLDFFSTTNCPASQGSACWDDQDASAGCFKCSPQTAGNQKELYSGSQTLAIFTLLEVLKQGIRGDPKVIMVISIRKLFQEFG